MLFNHGEIVMRILSKRQVKEMVLYTPQHLARLEKAGLFPKRVQLGPSRVGWVEEEVLDWMRRAEWNFSVSAFQFSAFS